MNSDENDKFQTILERFADIEYRLVAVEQRITKIYDSLDSAFSKFGAMANNPLFKTLLGAGKPKQVKNG